MPFWKRSASDDQQIEAQAQQDAEASLLSLEAGGLPIQAKRRLEGETAAGHPLFTSDLRANEFLLTRQPGYTPLGQVMGSTIYHRGTDSLTLKNGLDALSQAHQQAARLALGRLRQEAALLHAHGVVGVRFTRKCFAWEQEILEYVAIGTAIRLGSEPSTHTPFLCNLSGQDFWTLMQAGYYPVGVVTGFCSDAVMVCTAPD